MGRRSRQRQRDELGAPVSEYTDPEGNLLALRGSLSAGSRQVYAETLSGAPLSREDAWQRAVELLFEQLAARWVIADAPIERPRELLARFRAASPSERAWVREVLRAHCAEHFPELTAP